MGRPSRRAERRAEILAAFARLLAERGYAKTTIAAIAAEAGVAPGLVHHHFESKDELLTSLLEALVARFRARLRRRDGDDDAALAWGEAALTLGAHADLEAARCWVGLFAEGMRDPTLHQRLRRLLDREIEGLRRRSDYTLSDRDGAALVSFVVGALVVGAFAPQKTAGFAAPAYAQLLDALR